MNKLHYRGLAPLNFNSTQCPIPLCYTALIVRKFNYSSWKNSNQMDYPQWPWSFVSKWGGFQEISRTLLRVAILHLETGFRQKRTIKQVNLMWCCNMAFKAILQLLYWIKVPHVSMATKPSNERDTLIQNEHCVSRNRSPQIHLTTFKSLLQISFNKSSLSLIYKHHTFKCRHKHPQAQEVKDKCCYNASFNWSVETGVKKKWFISVQMCSWIISLSSVLSSITVWQFSLKCCSVFDQATLDLSKHPLY